FTPADIQAEDLDAFDQGVLTGQDAAINGLPLAQPCIGLNAERPKLIEVGIDGAFSAAAFLRGVAKHGFRLAGGIAEGILAIVTLSIGLETFSDDPLTALNEQANALQELLQRLGIDKPMQLFTGAGVDLENQGCELLLTPIFR